MTIRRLVCGTLLGAAILGFGVSAARAGSGLAPVEDLTPPYLEPGPWWWAGARGEAYYAILAHPNLSPTRLPPGIEPVDPPGTSVTKHSGASSSPAKGSTTSSFASPGASSVGLGGAMAIAPAAGAGPARPDSRLVRRELEAARRALGL